MCLVCSEVLEGCEQETSQPLSSAVIMQCIKRMKVSGLLYKQEVGFYMCRGVLERCEWGVDLLHITQLL